MNTQKKKSQKNLRKLDIAAWFLHIVRPWLWCWCYLAYRSLFCCTPITSMTATTFIQCGSSSMRPVPMPCIMQWWDPMALWIILVALLTACDMQWPKIDDPDFPAHQSSSFNLHWKGMSPTTKIIFCGLDNMTVDS